MKDSPELAVEEPGPDPEALEASADAQGGPAQPGSTGDDPDSNQAAPEPTGDDPEAKAAEAESEDGESEPEPEQEDDSATDEELVAQVSALLFASPDPLGIPRMATVLGTTRARVKKALAQVTERVEQAGLGIEVRGLAGGSTFMTVPALGELVAGLSKQVAVERISPAALETLSVVAYRGPVTKAEIEAIRGVQAGPMLRSLVDRGLVRVVGRSEDPGHALLYGTTKEFLFRFGLESLADLPRDGELARN